MADGYEVDIDQLRGLASRLFEFSDQFDAVTTASQAISQDDQAYGLLCEWMPAILEGRHEAFDEWVVYGQENMQLLAEAIRGVADGYEASDEDAAKALGDIGQEMGP